MKLPNQVMKILPLIAIFGAESVYPQIFKMPDCKFWELGCAEQSRRATEDFLEEIERENSKQAECAFW